MRSRLVELWKKHGALLARPESSLSAPERTERAALEREVARVQDEIDRAEQAVKAQRARRLVDPEVRRKIAAELEPVLGGRTSGLSAERAADWRAR